MGGGEGRKVTSQVVQGLGDHWEDLSFYLKESGSPGGFLSREKPEPDSGAHGHPLVVVLGNYQPLLWMESALGGHNHALAPGSHQRCAVTWPGERPGCRPLLTQAETTRPM